ncbi:MAG TPA: electron transfer flavoprotein subunit alpha/FixB family protein [Syntrophomonadaceae bacterium]|nr:electron transfer flavoprotein subunit alpha/FixB family protein [Syntrophomonadaceae bacterium]
MAGILVFSDKLNLGLELITAAKAINQEVKALAINDDKLAEGLAAAGAQVYKVENNDINIADVAGVASTIQQIADQEGLSVILLASNHRGKELAGRLAQKMEAGCLTDVSNIEVDGDKIACRRNALGGATIATELITVDKKVIAVAPRSFEPAGAGAGSITNVEITAPVSKIKLVEVKAKSTDAVDIEAAEFLVTVGQGLNSQDDLGSVEQLAKAIGGEVACTKPVATDKKWLSEERVVGLSGKICKPELAILLGISGQVQFTVGIRDAKTIVSINSDENASMNQMADYILTADLHEAVKELNSKLG